MEKEIEVRKGPWTEQEDVQLALYVSLFGDRRWDFIAKVSGLKRTGKSCRLRWVNYLHPGLKRGKMTPHEERLVLQLHSKWGNRWSRIARKLPGRTDNEIKNYWRTHMRKKAQDQRKKAKSSAPSSSISSSNSSSSSVKENKERNFYDTGGVDLIAAPGESKRSTTVGLEVEESSDKVYSMDDLWKEFEFNSQEISCKLTWQANVMASPIWDYCPNDSLWSMDEHQSNNIMMQQPMGCDHFPSFPFYNHMAG